MFERTISYGAAVFFLILGAGCAKQVPLPPMISPGVGTIVVQIEGFRNDRGVALVSLFSNAEGFPEDTEKALRNAQSAISNQKATVVFEEIPYGIYAISVLHDENRNGKMDSNFLGMPKEGHGVSNNVQKKFAPPKFEEAKFLFDTEELNLSVEVHYVQRKRPWD